MKKGIHPEFQDTVFKCACGAEIHTRSSKPEFKPFNEIRTFD